MTQKYKVSSKLGEKIRQNIEKQNAHYIICTANDLLNSNEHLISNEFPTKQTVIGYVRDFERQKRKQKKLERGIDLKKSDVQKLGEI